MISKTTKTTSTTASPVKEMTVDNASVKEDEMKNSSLHKFFISALKDIYYAENAILEALEKMQDAATTDELKEAFEDHHLQTQKHVKRLEKVFGLIDEKPEKKECEAIKGIIKEGEEVIKSTEEGSMTRDAALIIAAQKVEHYEIATYGGLAQLAITMGHDKAAELLERTLQEEEDTDEELTEIAENFINFDAEKEG
ncbi:ferritin-like domain-containing protein [Chryseobacterium gallinarum]|uniref:YciE/YciF ferroxidase family protein n=1 Tax=Chryseobacterium gallinarum TaxID=1324352 RepID=UPI0020249335|nr:ferritin-like domain-containing protein [Chryseobacterium gallinarum]MCL8537920.1 ferritin-like domain-containing protein [Chryseobacterium gallinarum]